MATKNIINFAHCNTVQLDLNAQHKKLHSEFYLNLFYS